MDYILRFEEVGKDDVGLVGGKNASLGEMIQNAGVPVPPGLATTTHAYEYYLKENDIEEKMDKILTKMDSNDVKSLKNAGKKIRKLILNGEIPEDLKEQIVDEYHNLRDGEDNPKVAVRSSATAEDIENASFAGQQDTYLNVEGVKDLLKKVKMCFASLYTDRAIHYREERDFVHLEVALSVGIQVMVDAKCAGVAFSIDPDSGFDKVVTINGNWGLGPSVVSGMADVDKYYYFKPTKSVISKRLGRKEIKVVGKDEREKTSEKERGKYVLNDSEIEELGEYVSSIEEYYDRPMDTEWAKDRDDNIFILQARPETVHSLKEKHIIKEYRMKEQSEVLVEGESVGRKIGSGKVKEIDTADNLDKFNKGEVLVTDMTNPDYEPVMKVASAIITDKGGSTSHAAIVSRELGVPCIIGTENATEMLEDGDEVTADCTSETGKVWKGQLDFEVNERNIKEIPDTKTDIMMNVGVPEKAFDLGQYPVDGVGLAREEFIISSHIGAHPLYMIEQGREDEYVEKLSYGIAKIAAGFYPNPVIVRLSDFKTNEYADLEGGEKYEPEENNPLTGWRGASRYIDGDYKPAFRLECEALRKVRNDMGLSNIKVMVPFCRTLNEAKQTLKVMEDFGLEEGKDDLEVYVMAEIPSNIISADNFAEMFDGFSIGTNDLTSLTLGIDRDNEKLIDEFDERDEAVKRMVSQLIEKAHNHNKKVGICGDAPSTHPDYAKFLVEEGIDSISVTPDVALKTRLKVKEAEE
ncbi:MAG: phosphoenolpyruvate synthase [Candidatus Aenigmatarchaeota archaeon]